MLTPDQIASLLQPYVTTSPKIVPRGTIQPQVENVPRGTIAIREPDWPSIHQKLATYLELILKWNARTNLTAIREPEQIVQRHFGESLFTALHLGPVAPEATLLDFGSGAGFPGIPIQLLYPELHVTLAESQGKKAAFLREAVRVLELPAEVWSHRVEAMPASRNFDIVTLRAVDDMSSALAEATSRANSTLAILTTRSASLETLLLGFCCEPVPLPNSADGILLLGRREAPRSGK